MSPSIYFFDSSGLVKHYIDEVGSEWVQKTLSTREVIVAITEIGIVEVVAAFAKRERMKEITSSEYSFARRVFLKIVDQYNVISVSREVINRAVKLTDRHPLRAYDAVQLATALQLADALAEEDLALTFVSADERLCEAAEQETLTVVNPNLLTEAS